MYHSQTYYAAFWQRLLAWLLDGVILTILFFILLFIISVGYPTASVYDPQTGTTVKTLSSEGAIAVLISAFVVPYFYYAFFESSHFQATPGKLALGIYVSTTNGGEVDFATATMRYMVRGLLSGWCVSLGYWMFFFTARKQCLHDLVSGTIVVRNVDEHEVGAAPTRPLHSFDPGLAAHEDYWDGSQWVKRPILPPGHR
jgi:uncharacterized RDD family membrane protein YckC